MTKQTQTTFQWHQIAICIIIAFTFFMSGFVSERVFERLPHLEDEVAYLYQARIFAGGQVVVDSPQPTSAYWQPFVVDYAETGNRFGKYTPGWSALLAIGVVLGYEQIVNMLVSALTIALVYRLGREIFNSDVGLIGALLVAFSPAALLLNGTLMSHTTGLFFTTLFIYAYWRIEKNRQTISWGIVAGVSLGILAATRPLTTLGIGLPFIIWSGVRLLFVLNQPKQFVSRLLPLLTLSVFALFFASSIPAFSQVATGDYQQNLYELVWSYDRIGFGDCCGRNFHRLQKAVNHARFDLSLTAADLFGWQFEPVTDEMIRHLQTESDYYEGTGYSFYLLPFGIIIGLQLLSPF
ncbi:MAG: glycosyltransferase family 39 protein, partial [Chloroflexota bacterium]